MQFHRTLTSSVAIFALCCSLYPQEERSLEEPLPLQDEFSSSFDEMNAEEEYQMLVKTPNPSTVCPPAPEPLCTPSEGIKIELDKDGKNILDEVRGIVLVDSKENLMTPAQLEGKTGLYIGRNLKIPGTSAQLAERLSLIYKNQPLTLKKIKEIKRVIHEYYVENNYPFTLVLVPTQPVSTNMLQLMVCPAKLGKIVMEGNKYANTSLVKRYLSIKPGDPIHTSGIQNDLSFINKNPYRRVDALYAAGTDPCTTDLIIPVEERKPLRVYVGADNTGIETIRRQRLFTGFGFNSFLGFDNNLNFQYTTAYKPKTFQSYTAQWMVFLPWENILNLFGGYSKVHTILPFPEMRNEGEFIQASGRYTVPFVLAARYPMEFSVGFDFKRTNSNIFFSELFPNTSSAANIAQFLFEGRWSFQGDVSRLELVTEVRYSPGNLVPDQSQAQYSNLRPGANPKYVYGKVGVRYIQWLPADFETLLWVRSQISNAALLPSEQYGIGGFDTVRGYDENQLSMDNALNANFEIRTPGIQIISAIRKMKKKDALQFLGFLDYGIGWNKAGLPGEATASWLCGAGPGARYTLDPNIAIRLDWGWKLKKTPKTGVDLTHPIPYTGGPSMVQFSSTISY